MQDSRCQAGKTADGVLAAYKQHESVEAVRLSLCIEEDFEVEAIFIYRPDCIYLGNLWVLGGMNFLRMLFLFFIVFLERRILSSEGLIVL